MTQPTYVDPIVQQLMGSISDIEDMPPWCRGLIYGDTGVGKTTLAAGMPRNLFVEADVGNLVALLSPIAQAQGGQFKRFQFSNFETVESLATRAAAGTFNQMFMSYTIDKLTDLSFDNLTEITTREHGTNSLRQLLKPQTDDYTENNERLRRLVATFRKAPANLLVLCHHRYFKDKNGIVKVGPDFSEKLTGNLASMFNFVGHMYREDDGQGGSVRYLQLQPTALVTAKCNIDGLPATMINPTWREIYGAYTAMRNRQLAGA